MENKITTKATLEVSTPLEFEKTTEVEFISPKNFAAQIDSLFSPVFDDYEGCEIRANTNNVVQTPVGNMLPQIEERMVNDVPVNEFYASLFFKYNEKTDDTKIKNLTLVGGNPKVNPVSNNRLAERFRVMTASRCMSSIYSVSEDTKEMLEEFMYAPNVGINTKLTNGYWKNHISEFSRAQLNYVGIPGTPTVYVKISGLNLSALASKLYGSTDDNGGKAEYRVQACIPTTSNGIAKDVILQITKLNSTVLQNVLNGMYSGSYITSTYYR